MTQLHTLHFLFESQLLAEMQRNIANTHYKIFTTATIYLAVLCMGNSFHNNFSGQIIAVAVLMC